MKPLIWSNSGWIDETDPYKLKEQYNKKLLDADFTILSFQEHYFKPQGYSALWLLAESHLALHTFPEENITYYELSSCVKKQFDKFNGYKL